MMAMFGVFGGWFLFDWKIGYPRENLTYSLHAAFERAGREFADLDAGGGLSPSALEIFVERQVVDLPEDPALLPPGTPRPMPWPEILKDHGRMATDGWHKLWLEFTAAEMPDAPAPTMIKSISELPSLRAA